MVVVWTCAYNAERTIGRTIESVLNQTYTDFVYYVRDNASTDKTRDVINAYAERDKRVVPIYGITNDIPSVFEIEKDVLAGCSDNDYACFLDADDEYMPDFISRTIKLSQEYDLDIIASPTLKVNEETGEKGYWFPPVAQNYILDLEGLKHNFWPLILYMGNAWGKLYRASVLKHKMPFDREAIAGLAGDSINTIAAFAVSSRVCFLKSPLHIYHIHGDNDSQSARIPEIRSIDTYYHMIFDVFLYWFGEITPSQRASALNYFYDYLRNRLAVLRDSQAEAAEKIGYVNALLKSVTFHAIWNSGMYRDIPRAYFGWLYSEEMNRNIDMSSFDESQLRQWEICKKKIDSLLKP